MLCRMKYSKPFTWCDTHVCHTIHVNGFMHVKLVYEFVITTSVMHTNVYLRKKGTNIIESIATLAVSL